MGNGACGVWRGGPGPEIGVVGGAVWEAVIRQESASGRLSPPYPTSGNSLDSGP